MIRWKRGKRALGLFLAVILLAAACSPRTGSGEGKDQNGGEQFPGIRIGITFDTFVLERWTRDRDIFVDTARKMGASVDVQTANGDVEKQKAQIRKFIEDDVNAIVIVAVDCYSLKDEVETAREKGIPVISYDRLIQSAVTDLYITVDNVMVGTLMARSIKENLPDGGNVVMICGPEADSNSMDVVEGFEKEISGGSWKIVYKNHVQSWAAENGMQAVEDAFVGTRERIDAIMCGNDGLAGYVIRSLSERQLAGNVVVAAQDADLEACQRIVEGTQTMTVYKPINDLAKEAAEYTVRMAQGEKLEISSVPGSALKEMENGEHVLYLGLAPTAVTAANIDDVIIGSGFHSREEVYLNVGK